MSDTYDFTVKIQFRVEADTEYDALSSAFDVEDSLTRASITESMGGHAHVVRAGSPIMFNFRHSGKKLPSGPAYSDGRRAVRNRRLARLLSEFTVRLRDVLGRERDYSVFEPTEERAINRARLHMYHDTSALSPEVVSVTRS